MYVSVVDVMLKSMHKPHESDICEFFNVGTENTSVDVTRYYQKYFKCGSPIIKKELPKGDPVKSEVLTKIRDILNIDLAKLVTLENGLQKTINSLLSKV